MFAGIVPGSGVPPSRDEIRNDQWLGVAVTSQGPGEFLSIIYHLILLSLFNYELQAGRWWYAPIATRGGAWTTDGDRASASHSPTNSSLMRHGSPAEDGTLTGQLIWFTTQCSSSFYACTLRFEERLCPQKYCQAQVQVQVRWGSVAGLEGQSQVRSSSRVNTQWLETERYPIFGFHHHPLPPVGPM